MIVPIMRTPLRACTVLSVAVVLTGCYRVTMPGVSFTPDTGWIREEPTSDHRMIQYRLQGDRTQVGDARLVVYHFGAGGAGSTDANITRWAGQFRQPDGRSTIDVAGRDEFEVNGIPVRTIAIEGTYVAAVTPGSEEHLNRPHRGLRAAVVLTDAGPYYFKVVGPVETVDRWTASLAEMIASLKPARVPERSPADPDATGSSR